MRIERIGQRVFVCMVLIGAAALVVALSGCAVGRSIAAKDAQSSLIGRTKAEILACAGIPHSAMTEGGMEILAYHYGGDSRSFGFGTSEASATRTGPNSATASGTGTSVTTTQARQCTANFVFQNDRLVRLNYSGRTGGILTSSEQCAFIVQNCVH